MKLNNTRSILALAICGVLATVASSQAQNADNDVLRRTQMQLRQSEQERNSLRGEVARLQAQLDAQRVEFDRMSQQSVKAEVRKDSTAAELAAKNARLSQVNQSLLDARDELASTRADNARRIQAVQNVQTMLDNSQKNAALREELLGVCRERNAQLYQVGQQLIAMYRDRDFNSFTKREPVLQLQQVKLQNLMQDFEDRLRSQRMYEDTLPPSLEKQMQDSLNSKSNENHGS